MCAEPVSMVLSGHMVQKMSVAPAKQVELACKEGVRSRPLRGDVGLHCLTDTEINVYEMKARGGRAPKASSAVLGFGETSNSYN
jgi:hypothetical protein